MLVEGVKYEVNWRTFKRNKSIFVPCLNPAHAAEDILRVTKRLRVQVLMKEVIVEGIRGLRVWRQ
jgi:hypothetical protein